MEVLYPKAISFWAAISVSPQGYSPQYTTMREIFGKSAVPALPPGMLRAPWIWDARYSFVGRTSTITRSGSFASWTLRRSAQAMVGAAATVLAGMLKRASTARVRFIGAL